MRVFPSIFYVYNQDEHSEVSLLKDLETLISFVIRIYVQVFASLLFKWHQDAFNY